MQGTLSEFTLAEILQLFALAERTGTITVETSMASARLFLESGRVVGVGEDTFDVYRAIASCELLPARSGSSLDAVKPVPGSPGLSFIVRNLIEPERWDLFTRRCLEQQIYPLLSVQLGTFSVKIERIPPCPLSVTVPVQQLILDGSRWEAEMAEHRQDGYGKASAWLRLEQPRSATPFTSVEWLAWALLEAPSTIGEIAGRLGIPDLEVTAAVRRLAERGVLSPAV